MNRPRDVRDDDDALSGYCRNRACAHCHGNVDLKVGPGPAVPLHRCACPCHRGRIRQGRRT